LARLIRAIAALLVLLTACSDGDSGPNGTASPPADRTASTVRTPLTPSQTSLDLTGVPPEIIYFNTNRDGNFEIYSVKTDRSDLTNLTKNPAYDFDPDLSPDGEQIVFASNRDGGNPKLFIMSSDGSDVHPVTDKASGEQAPRWSRDGKRIAFSRSGSLWVVNPDGTDERMIMASQPEQTAEDCRAGSFPGGWSADDKRITYYAASISRGEGQICTVGVDDGDIEVIVSEPRPALYAEPAWSPDGKRIA